MNAPAFIFIQLSLAVKQNKWHISCEITSILTLIFFFHHFQIVFYIYSTLIRHLDNTATDQTVRWVSETLAAYVSVIVTS